MDPHHNATVLHISQQVQSFSSQKLPFHIYHGTTSSTRRASYTRSNTIDTSSLNRVLRITNTAHKKTALVEPNVSMDVLVKACLKEGLVPLVVMEFPGITVGGGFAGTSGESSSFRYGFFDRIVCWVEMVLADGEVVEAYPASASSEEEEEGERERKGKNEDLFYGAASSFGTLGITTCLEVKLRNAKPFVQLSYFPISSAEEMREKINEVALDMKYEYLDGILFGKDKGVVCAGFLADREESSSSSSSTSSVSKMKTKEEECLPIQHFTRPQDPWFYTHAEDVLTKYYPQSPESSSSSSSSKTSSSSLLHTELIPTTDYFFRYDRGAFWGGRYSFSYFLVPFNAFTRWVLDPFMHTRVMYHALHKSGLAKRYVIQDVGIPSDKLDEFVDYLHEEFGYYPLWICPLKEQGVSGVGNNQKRKKGYGPIIILAEDETSTTHPQSQDGNEQQEDTDTSLIPESINVGIWGPCPWGSSSPSEFKAYNRRLEQKVHSLGGQKCLYAHTYYTEEEFWAIYDRETYRKLREKYHAEYLPDLWEKVRVKDDNNAVDGRKGNNGWGRRVWGWVKEIWPLRGVYGVLSVVVGAREYLL